jgi:hypothetical protein
LIYFRYGQTSNVLMEWGALMRLAVTAAKPPSPSSPSSPRAVIVDELFQHFIGDGFDVIVSECTMLDPIPNFDAGLTCRGMWP